MLRTSAGYCAAFEMPLLLKIPPIRNSVGPWPFQEKTMLGAEQLREWPPGSGERS
jgi:hypothetical protein